MSSLAHACIERQDHLNAITSQILDIRWRCVAGLHLGLTNFGPYRLNVSKPWAETTYWLANRWRFREVIRYRRGRPPVHKWRKVQ